MTNEKELANADTELSPSDLEAIERTSLDYLEGWYTGDAAQIGRALHPELVKRTVMQDKVQGWMLKKPVSFEQMVGWAGEGGGSDVPEAERIYEITIHHGFRHMATVSALSPMFMDYLHLAKVEERWVIVNVLWELREGAVKE